MSRKKAYRCKGRVKAQANMKSRQDDTQLAVPVTDQSDQLTAPTPTRGDLAQDLDRDWFRTHPYRSHRIRHAIPGEVPGAPPPQYAIVRQILPGLRIRQYFDTAVPLLLEDEAPEHTAYALYDLLWKYRGRGVLIPDHEVVECMRAYATGSDADHPCHGNPSVVR
jgi:hypothetical protein